MDLHHQQNETPPEKIVVNYQVHATMDDDVVKCFTPDDEKPITKKPLMATAEQKCSYDELFQIEFDVDWRVASKNLHRYRLKTDNKLTSSGFQRTVRRVKNRKNLNRKFEFHIFFLLFKCRQPNCQRPVA